MSAAEWLDRVDARMDRTGYHPEKDATVAMSAALRAVLDLHQPITYWMPHAEADLSFEDHQDAVDYADGDWDPIPLVLCDECRRMEESPDDGETTRALGYRDCLYPCQTVRRITEALT